MLGFLPIALPADTLADVRQALAFNAVSQDVVLNGTGTIMKSPGAVSFRIGDGGKFLYSIKAPLGQSVGFDGTTMWLADYSGATRTSGFGERDQELLTVALLTSSWAKPGTKVEFLPTTAPNTISFRLAGSHITPTVTIDAATHLPVRATFATEAGEATVAFSDWRVTPLGKLPFKMLSTSASVTDTMQLNEAVQVPRTAAYGMPSWKPIDTTFETGANPVLETRRLPSGHLLVKGNVNGSDLGWFILDTGAEGMCIDSGKAEGLKLPKLGTVPAVGIGGVVETSIVRGNTFKVGGMSIKNLAFVELDLSEISKLVNVDLGGIIGYDVFRRCVARLDVSAPRVEIHNPTSASVSGLPWQALRFEGAVPAIQASFEGGREGWFRLDTGASGTVAFHGPFVESMKLLEGRDVKASQQGGVGGFSESRTGPMEYFTMAGHRFEKPEVTFSLAKVGAFHNDWLVGNIGQKFLDPFQITVDYANARIAFAEKK